MPFFTTSPTIRMIPMNEETFSAVPVASSMAKTPRTDSGAADMMIKAGGKRAELNHQDNKNCTER